MNTPRYAAAFATLLVAACAHDKGVSKEAPPPSEAETDSNPVDPQLEEYRRLLENYKAELDRAVTTVHQAVTAVQAIEANAASEEELEQEVQAMHAKIRTAIEKIYGTELGTTVIRAFLEKAIFALVSEKDISGDAQRALNKTFWEDIFVTYIVHPAEREILLKFVGNNAERMLNIAQNVSQVIKELPPDMQLKLASEFGGFLTSWRAAYRLYPRFKAILGHHTVFNENYEIEEGYEDPCGHPELHKEYEEDYDGRLPPAVKAVLRMLYALDQQKMPLHKVEEAVGIIKTAFGL